MELTDVRAVVREETRFAGIRQPYRDRAELPPRMDQVRELCGDAVAGPLTHILRFDTGVDGFDSEIGFPVSSEVRAGPVETHTLRRLPFFSYLHTGPVEALRSAARPLVEHLSRVGLSPELEWVEIYHTYDPKDERRNRIELRLSYLAWPEVYRDQLVRVLGERSADRIWAGGERITPFTYVDERAAWVGDSLSRLKERADCEQQFDILSRVALVRPLEDIRKYQAMYTAAGRSIQAVLDAQNAVLSKESTGGWIDPPWSDDTTLHLSKVAYDRAAYCAAKTPAQRRKGYCFCTLVREAAAPKIDPIFCYRAAGWARQFWEPILETTFRRCTITHSILKGDPFCAWDFHLDSS